MGKQTHCKSAQELRFDLIDGISAVCLELDRLKATAAAIVVTPNAWALSSVESSALATAAESLAAVLKAPVPDVSQLSVYPSTPRIPDRIRSLIEHFNQVEARKTRRKISEEAHQLRLDRKKKSCFPQESLAEAPPSSSSSVNPIARSNTR
jgi:DNA-binding transcriptional regulator YbjK